MGWTSSSTHAAAGAARVRDTKDEAIAYATREGIAYRVEEPQELLRRGLSYSDNFKYNRTMPWTH